MQIGLSLAGVFGNPQGEIDTEIPEEEEVDDDRQEGVIRTSTAAEGRKTRTMRNKEV